jgi:hypothetical protein
MKILNKFVKELEEKGGVGFSSFSYSNDSVFYEGRNMIRDGVIEDVKGDPFKARG